MSRGNLRHPDRAMVRIRTESPFQPSSRPERVDELGVIGWRVDAGMEGAYWCVELVKLRGGVKCDGGSYRWNRRGTAMITKWTEVQDLKRRRKRMKTIEMV